MNVLIIEDEASARASLKALLQKLEPDAIVLGEADTLASGVQLLREHPKFDLLFLDINLPDGSGLDVANSMDDLAGRVVVATAYDQHGIDAVKKGCFDYILKPYSVKELIAVFQRLRKALEEESQQELQTNSSSGRISVPDLHGSLILEVDNIVRCEAQKNYTSIVLTNDRPILASKTLKEFENKLTEHGFLRVHKSHLINPKHVLRFNRKDSGSLTMTDGQEVRISESLKKDILKKVMG